jgi:hypothetical protein
MKSAGSSEPIARSVPDDLLETASGSTSLSGFRPKFSTEGLGERRKQNRRTCPVPGSAQFRQSLSPGLLYCAAVVGRIGAMPEEAWIWLARNTEPARPKATRVLGLGLSGRRSIYLLIYFIY